MLKLAENREYLKKKKEHETMLSEVRKIGEEMHRAKCKLQDLDNNPLGKWDLIEEVRKEYCNAEKRVNELQAKKDIDFKNIVEEQRPETISRGLEINKQILKRITELEELKEQYLKLEDEWKQYNGLAPIKAENIADTIGPNPYYAVHQKHNPIFEGFIKASEAYQKRNEK